MGTLKVQSDSLDLSSLDTILHTKDIAENILSDVKLKFRYTHSSTSTNVDDKDIKALFAINASNLEFNNKLNELKQPLKNIVNRCDEIIDPVYSTIDSFSFRYEDVKKPSKAYVGLFVGATGLVVMDLMALLGALSGGDLTSVIPGAILLLIAALILAFFGFKSKMENKKQTLIYEHFINIELPNSIAQLEKECTEKLDDILSICVKEFNTFISSPENNPLIYDEQLLTAESQLNDKLSYYHDEYGKFINDQSLLVESIEVITDKRAKTLSEAINTVKNDRHMKQIEDMQRQQTAYAREAARQAEIQADYAREQAYQAERQANAAEKSAKAEQERTNEIKRALRK